MPHTQNSGAKATLEILKVLQLHLAVRDSPPNALQVRNECNGVELLHTFGINIFDTQ
jgi:hypothetical protein